MIVWQVAVRQQIKNSGGHVMIFFELGSRM